MIAFVLIVHKVFVRKVANAAGTLNKFDEFMFFLALGIYNFIVVELVFFNINKPYLTQLYLTNLASHAITLPGAL